VTRGAASLPPPGGYQPADLIFFGVDDGPGGHVALWLGNGMIVQCSSSGDGSNIRPLAGYVPPTGWVRWATGVKSTG
jgi:cell wall-associated NlpC family hydrolase